MEHRKEEMTTPLRCVCIMALAFFLQLVGLQTPARGEGLSWQTLRAACGDRRLEVTGWMPEGVQLSWQPLGEEAYDITLRDGQGRVYQPAACPVMVSLEGCDGALWHRAGEDWERVPHLYLRGKVLFLARHFSIYALTRAVSDRPALKGTAEGPGLVYRFGESVYSAQEMESLFGLKLPSVFAGGNLLKQAAVWLEGASLADGQETVPVAAYLESGKPIVSVAVLPQGVFVTDSAENAGPEDILASWQRLAEGEGIIVDLAEQLPAGRTVLTRVPEAGLRVLVCDRGNGQALEAEFGLYDASGICLWTSAAPSASHVIPGELFEEGTVYGLSQISAQEGYAVPGFAWHVTCSDGSFSVAEKEVQAGAGRDEALPPEMTPEGLVVANERFPVVHVHPQLEGMQDYDQILCVGDPAPVLARPEAEGFLFMAWSTQGGSLSSAGDLQLDTGCGAENDVYAIWCQKAEVCVRTYTMGRLENSTENTQDGEKAISAGDLMSGDIMASDVQRLSGIDLPQGYTLAFMCPEGSQEAVTYLSRLEHPQDGTYRIGFRTGSGTEAAEMESGKTICLYYAADAIPIPLRHVLAKNGQFHEREDAGELPQSLEVPFNGSCSLSALTAGIQQSGEGYALAYGFAADAASLDPAYTTGQITYRAQGLFLTDAQGEEQRILLSEDDSLYCAGYPSVRTLGVHLLMKQPDGSFLVMDEWLDSGFSEGLAVSDRGYTVRGRAFLAAEHREEAVLLHTYCGPALAEGQTAVPNGFLTETEVANVRNTLSCLVANALSDHPILLYDPATHEDYALYAVFYENPRKLAVHAVEYGTSGYILQDEAWQVQPILVPNRRQEANTYDPRGIMDEDQVFGDVLFMAEGQSVTGLRENNKVTHLANTENGIRITISQVGSGMLGKNELYYVYFPRIRTIPVVYQTVQGGSRTTLGPERLDASAPVSVGVSTQEQALEGLGRAASACLTQDGYAMYQPNFRIGLGTAGGNISGYYESVPLAKNTCWRISCKKDSQSAAQSVKISDGPTLYVLYDHSLDRKPAYLRLANLTQNSGTLTFRLRIGGGSYAEPVLVKGSRDGIRKNPGENGYVFELQPGSQVMVYLPRAAGLAYEADILDASGSLLNSRMEEHNLALSRFPVSDELSGSLAQGDTYYWNSAEDNRYTAILGGEGACTSILLTDGGSRTPAPTGLSDQNLRWAGTLAVCAVLAGWFALRPRRKRQTAA